MKSAPEEEQNDLGTVQARVNFSIEFLSGNDTAVDEP